MFTPLHTIYYTMHSGGWPVHLGCPQIDDNTNFPIQGTFNEANLPRPHPARTESCQDRRCPDEPSREVTSSLGLSTAPPRGDSARNSAAVQRLQAHIEAPVTDVATVA